MNTAIKPFADGWYGEIIPLTFGRARIILCHADHHGTYEDGW